VTIALTTDQQDLAAAVAGFTARYAAIAETRAALDGPGADAARRYLSLPPTLLGGGTLEIQLNVIAEQVLGLPR